MANNEINTVTLSVSSYNPVKNEEAVKFCYFERYKKKLATLRTQATKYGDKK